MLEQVEGVNPVYECCDTVHPHKEEQRRPVVIELHWNHKSDEGEHVTDEVLAKILFEDPLLISHFKTVEVEACYAVEEYLEEEDG